MGALRPSTAGWSLCGAASISAAIYGGLAVAGELRGRVGLLLAAQAALALLMLAAFRLVRAHPRLGTWALVAALAFRLLSVAGEPRLSDDVYRYVWDGRVQLHGIQPYRHAPDDPALSWLRDADWSRINHRHLGTLYPPLAELVFALLALCGAGPGGFRLALGLADFGVVVALAAWLARAGLPRERALLYAWNPLAVLETAGSGHVEPLGVLCLVLWASWAGAGRRLASTLALAASIDFKLVAGLVVPAHLRRAGAATIVVLVAAALLPLAPYLLAGGPLAGSGLTAYARTWEHNASIYPLLERGLGLCLEGRWPAREVARALLAAALLALALRGAVAGRRGVAAQALSVIGPALLLSPTVHPWYLLWMLPFAAVEAAPAWIAWSLLVPLAYWSPAGDVPWAVRVIEYVPVLLLLVREGAAGLLAWRR